MDVEDIHIREISYPRNFILEEITARVIVAEVLPALASKALSKFSEYASLQKYSLGHLKRIRKLRESNAVKLQMILCPEKDFESISDLVKEFCFCEASRNVVSVPKFPPVTRKEFDEWSSLWPIVFRPNEIDRERERGISRDELLNHLSHVELLSVLKANRDLSDTMNDIGIIVNPANSQVHLR
jgi:tRNA-specific adenosine deaminase 3